jgi:hypothetical protein
MERTDPRYVTAEVDLLWAADGLASQSAVAAILNKFTTRVQMLHVKDGINIEAAGNASPRVTGTAEMDFNPLFAAAKNRTKYYHAEQDGANLQNSSDSLANLTGDPAPVIQAWSPTFPAGTDGGMQGAPVDMKVTNTGDAPLTVTAVAIQAYSPQGLTTLPSSVDSAAANDFTVTGQTCTAAPIAPGATCIVSIAFKPTRAVTTSVARVRLTSNADDATERILLVAKSGNAVNVPLPVGADIPSMLSLQVGGVASFGSLTPASARDYTTTLTSLVTATTGDAALSVVDPSATARGHLANGTYSLAQALKVRATDAANPSTAYAPLTADGSPLPLLSWPTPTAGADLVTLGFQQTVGATEVLRAGTYAKTLTFTLSTTTP